MLREQGEASPLLDPPAPVVNRRHSRRQLDGGGGDAAEGGTFCTPPIPIDDVALMVSPIAEEAYANDPDLCGYYFFPYELQEEINSAEGGFEVSDMGVEWHRSAYAVNAKDYPNLDYALLHRDTHVQDRVRKSTPLISTDA